MNKYILMKNLKNLIKLMEENVWVFKLFNSLHFPINSGNSILEKDLEFNKNNKVVHLKRIKPIGCCKIELSLI